MRQSQPALMTDHGLVRYYAQRAGEYEKIYAKPERQHDLAIAARWLQSELAQRNVLEIGCGTGYWTKSLSVTAKAILATDRNPEVLAIARAKQYPKSNTAFALTDMRALPVANNSCDAIFGGFIWSHLPLQHLDDTLAGWHRLLANGGKMVFIDNVYVEGSNSPLTGRDEFGNAYQTRALQDGSQHRIIKNFPQREFIHQKLSCCSKNIELLWLEYFWLLAYKIERI